jgi:hypothetical protein
VWKLGAIERHSAAASACFDRGSCGQSQVAYDLTVIQTYDIPEIKKWLATHKGTYNMVGSSAY